VIHTIFLLAALFAASQQTVSVQQNNAGWCSPIFVNVPGPISVNCTGVDPRALARLNAELRTQKLSLETMIRKANEWAEKYKELEKRLADSEDDSELSRKAEEYLHDGELEKAGTILDEIIGREESEVERTAANHFNRGLVFELQFKPLDALPHMKKAYSYRPENLKYALSYASLLETESEFTTAEEVLLPSLARARQHSTEDTEAEMQLALAMHLLARVYSETQRVEQAERLYKEELTIYELPELGTSQHVSLRKITLLTELGTLYGRTQRFSEAYASYLAAINVSEPMVEENESTYLVLAADLMGDLGNLHYINHELAQAEAFYLKALALWKQLKDYPADIGAAMTNLGAVYDDEGRYEEAIKTFEGALDLIRAAARNNSAEFEPLLANTLFNVAVVYLKTGKLDEALKDSLEALEIRRRFAKSDPAAFTADLSASLNSVGKVYAALGDAGLKPEIKSQDFAKAESLYKEALVIRRTLAATNPGEYKPALVQTLKCLGELYFVTQENEEAVKVLSEAIKILTPLTDANSLAYSLDLSVLWDDLGSTYDNMGQYTEADDCYQRALAVLRLLVKKQPAMYPYLVMPLEHLAFFSFKRESYSKGFTYSKEVAEIGQKIFDENPSAANGEKLAAALLKEAQFLQLMKSKCTDIAALADRAKRASSSENVVSAATAVMEGCGVSK
jgi:tetratricopeptide (TPR) repeat protein